MTMLFPQKKLIVYELNEVPKRVLRWYTNRHPKSHLAKLSNRGLFAETVAKDTGILSPWITWATLHRGVINEQHTISDFGQDLSEIDREYPPLWQLLANAGVSTGIFGSLHSYPLPDNVQDYDFYVPDTFATGPETFPQSLETFQEFNLAMVDASGRNVSGKFPLGPATKFLTRAPLLGLRGTTMLRLSRQLLTERINPLRRVRRRTSQSDLAFDFFIKQLRKKRPRFTSFFTNHVASSMHRYWPGTFPEDYSIKEMPEEWIDQFNSEIKSTMDVTDRHIGQLMAFCRTHNDHALVVASSMGQEAVDNDEIVCSQLYIRDHSAFFRTLGLKPSDWSLRRAMLPRYVVQISEGSASKFRSKVSDIRVNGNRIRNAEYDENTFMFALGQVNLEPDHLEVTIGSERIDWTAAGLEITPIEDASGSYAYHVPEGILLVWNPTKEREQVIEETIPTHTIAPAILEAMGVTAPAHMG